MAPPDHTPLHALLTVVVIHYRSPELLGRCLARLADHAPGVRTLVVDSSGDARPERFGPHVEHLPVANHSMAAAANAGMRRATTRFVAHMNADVFIGPDTFRDLLAVLERPGVGLVGPINRAAGGDLQPLGPLYRLHYLRLRLARRGSVSVGWVVGSLQLVRRSTLEAVGGLDASLRFYNEDIEWCWRLRRAGLGCHLVATEVVHLSGASTPRHPAFIVEGYRGGMKLSQRYLPRWYRWAQRLAVRSEAALRSRFDRDPERREAYRLVGAMFAADRYDHSPFGPTLDDR